MATVTVIVPFFNREKFLAEAINSVLRQSFSDWQLLLIDDGSSDNSFAIAEEFATKDLRVKAYKRLEGLKGPCACRNLGARLATSKYVMFLDSDDLLTETSLAVRVKTMEENEDLDLAIFNMSMFESDNPAQLHLFNKDAKDTEGFLSLFFSMQTPWGTPCGFWKRDFFFVGRGL